MMLPSIRNEGVYDVETMNVLNIIDIVEESDLDKIVKYNVTYQLLGVNSDRISMEVNRENVSSLDREVLSYKINLDGTTSLIFYLVKEEVKFVFVSKCFYDISIIV